MAGQCDTAGQGFRVECDHPYAFVKKSAGGRAEVLFHEAPGFFAVASEDVMVPCEEVYGYFKLLKKLPRTFRDARGGDVVHEDIPRMDHKVYFEGEGIDSPDHLVGSAPMFRLF